MRFRLIPRDESFHPLFEEQAAHTAATAAALVELVSSLPASAEGVRAIVDAERAGDEINKRIRSLLETSIVTPFDREDIQTLANTLDDVLDEMRAIADHLQLHNISTSIPGVNEQVALLATAAEANVRLVGKLRTLRDTQPIADEIERIESLADAMYRKVTAELFNG